MILSSEQVAFMQVFSKSCRRSILEMVTNAQSGHPGGSLSSIDFLSLLYLGRVAENNEPVVVSNGHISPAVYSVLAELGVIPKKDVLKSFRKSDDLYEGHVNRKISGIWYGTGPLGIGASVAAGLAIGKKIQEADPKGTLSEAKALLKSKKAFVFLLMGDGEQQEGQVYEMMNFAAKYKLGNLIAFIDENEVQLSDSLAEIMPMNIQGHYEAAGWQVLEVDGHDFEAMAEALGLAMKEADRPSLLLARTVMGKGVEFMELAGLAKKADWHGKAPKKDETEAALKKIDLSESEQKILKDGLANLKVKVKTSYEIETGKIEVGETVTYEPGVMTDCRSAYGKALLDLAKLNPQVLALTADLSESVKTDGVKREFPDRHIECGIAEQHMMSSSGGLSLLGLVPFCSTFGAFMTSRAKDQARVNDINETNVKMVATHCGLSVGEDGPTHQVLDDVSSFAGFFHTSIFEPADPNQCDRMIRAVAAMKGNAYVRMGRAKIPILTKEDGTPFFAGDYEWKPGKADVLRTGKRATIVASGPMVAKALAVVGKIGDIELIVVSSFFPFDFDTIVSSAKKTGRVLTVQDHNIDTGLGSFVQEALFEAGISVPVKRMGVSSYQLSGTAEELYTKAGLSEKHIEDALKELLKLRS